MIDTNMKQSMYSTSSKKASSIGKTYPLPEIIDVKNSSSSIQNINPKTQDLKINKLKNCTKCTGGRMEKVDADLYYRVKDENEQLKKQKLLNNEKIKKLEVSVANLKENLIKERKLEERKGLNSPYNKDLENTKNENTKLKDEVSKLKIYIQGLQSGDKIKTKSGKRTVVKNPLQAHKEKNDQLALVSHLRQQLKESNEDRKNLINELAALRNSNYQGTKLRGSNPNINFKNTNNIDYQSGMEKANIQLDTNNKILELTKASLNDYIEKYEKERDKNRKLEAQLALMQGDSEKLAQYQLLIDDYKNREKKLEERIEDLCENPFLRQAEEQGNVFRKFKEAEKLLTENEKALRDLQYKNRELEKENSELKNNLNLTQIEKDKFKEEALRLKISNEEKERNSKNFEDQINLLGQYGEIDSNFAKMLNLLNLKNDKLKWENLNFLDKLNENNDNSPEYLNKEIEKLKIEKGVLGNELEKTKSLLQIQQQINEDMKAVQDFDLKKYQAEVKNLKNKIEELCKLVDIERLPKEYIIKDNTGNISLKTKADFINDGLPIKDGELLDDAITEFSRDEEEPDFSLNENAVDLYIGECVFEDGLENELNFNIENIMSFLSIDFYIHETQTSNIISGKAPMFNFQLTFRVNEDEHLINYLESDYIYIEVYYLRDNVESIFGKGKISLKELIDAETINKTNTRVINSICSLYFIEDQNLKIGSIHYKLRMRKPISEVLKNYRESNKFIREINPVQDLKYKNAEKIMEEYKNFGGKVYNVKVLITKANGLIVSGPPRRISPFFYYTFYKDQERYSNISSGNDPQFQDVATFTQIYDKAFHEYIENETLNVYIFDSMNPIEVDISNKEQVRLVNTNAQLNNDLIGVCKIPLNNLLLTDIVQGRFNIINSKGQNVGELVASIFWEEVIQQDNLFSGTKNLRSSGTMPYETKAFEDELIRRLAEALKNKGLNLHSAFEIFDMDQKGEISLVNFKNTLWFTLKFTADQQEMEHLVKVIFTDMERQSLNKKDFFQIFAMLLPHDGPAQDLIMQNNINNTMNIRPSQPNLISSSDNMKFSITGGGNSTIKVVEPENVSNNTTGRLKSGNNNNINNNLEGFGNQSITNREIKDIMKEVNEYGIKSGKRSAVDIYKLFDKDSSLRIDQKEFYNGFKKMGINLSNEEIRKMWKEIAGPNKNDFNFNEFKSFYNKYINNGNVRDSNVQINRSGFSQQNNNNMGNSMYSQQGNNNNFNNTNYNNNNLNNTNYNSNNNFNNTNFNNNNFNNTNYSNQNYNDNNNGNNLYNTSNNLGGTNYYNNNNNNNNQPINSFIGSLSNSISRRSNFENSNNNLNNNNNDIYQ